MSLIICEKHKTAYGDKTVIIFEGQSHTHQFRKDSKCPMCELEEKLADISNTENEPSYNAQAMGCGLEDRDITDRYQAMQYGWEKAMERIYDEVILK